MVREIKDFGEIERTEHGVIVRAKGMEDALSVPGVVCINPNDPPAERIYCKEFSQTPIFLPDEYDRATKEVLRSGNDIVVLGMNGYSTLNEQQCRAWGVKPGAYEIACEALLRTITELLFQKFPGIDVRFSHGASNLGVDRAIINVAKRLNRPQLGHSCPKFMFWVEDNGIPVYVGNDQLEYAERFVDSLDILIAANGRIQAFQHDITAAFLKLKHVIPVNVLRSISETGGPPAIGPNGEIEDAVAAFEQRVHLMATQLGFAQQDKFGELVDHVKDTVIGVCRSLLSPERAFQLD